MKCIELDTLFNLVSNVMNLWSDTGIAIIKLTSLLTLVTYGLNSVS